jgi:hypothetical protein
MPLLMVSVDPGVYCAGIALWDLDAKGALLSATDSSWSVVASDRAPWSASARESVRLIRDLAAPWTITTLVIEQPQVYVRSRSKGDPNDLITLALNAGAIAGALGARAVVPLRPAEWKGQTPKEVVEQRARARLSATEMGRLSMPSAASKRHNVWDAIGIGLRWLRDQGIRPDPKRARIKPLDSGPELL